MMAEPVLPSARLFIGLKVAPEIARELATLSARLDGSSIRRVAPADMHVTLLPPWQEEAIPAAVDRLSLAAQASRAFALSFTHAGYGPQPARPRLLWADCTMSEEMVVLRTALLALYGRTDERAFRPHVTLVRIKGNGRRVSRLHPIDVALTFTQHVESVELYQSPPAGEQGYRIVASAPLGEAVAALPDAQAAARGEGQGRGGQTVGS